jgi:hypothetical protein
MMFSSLVDWYPCFNETKLQGMEKKKQIPQNMVITKLQYIPPVSR